MFQLASSDGSWLWVLESPVEFKQNDLVDVKKHRRNRSLNQNRLYWSFLTWCISQEGGGLIEQGHFSSDALHSDIKAWIQSEYPHQFDFKKIFSSAELNSKEFNDFMELVERELMNNFFGIDTSKFWGTTEQGEMPF
jgi:hypothetical protein